MVLHSTGVTYIIFIYQILTEEKSKVSHGRELLQVRWSGKVSCKVSLERKRPDLQNSDLITGKKKKNHSKCLLSN